MDQQRKARRFGAAAILCALVFRLCCAGVPNRIYDCLIQPNIQKFVTKLETGRNVRFSASSEVFSEEEEIWPLFFRESPPPWISETEPEPTLPAFSGADKLEIAYSCSLRPDLEALLQQPLQWDLTGNEPSVLILHTHTTESYTKNGESYKETAAFRTLDENYNMLSIGSRVIEILAENGITAVHDRELHDYPSYNGSYTHARASMAALLLENPTVKLVLDLHRDASGSNLNQLRTVASIGGSTAGQLMFVMGTNAAGLEHEKWEQNLSLALKLQAQLETQAPGIMRPLSLRAQRFNQDMHPGAILVEVGAAGNTHEEAMLAAQELARAIVALAKGTE